MKRILTYVIAILALSFVLIGCGHDHNWSPATCESPQKCDGCGETQGAPLEHEWVEATCQEAKHCTKCLLVQGDVTPHDWVAATCTNAKFCSVCNETEGDPLGHAITEWLTEKEPSCSEEGSRVGFCERCSKECTEKIEKLPHNIGAWQVKEDFYFNSDGSVTPGSEIAVCTVCNAEIESREYSISLTLSQKNAVICAYDEVEFWNCGKDYLLNQCLVDWEGFPYDDARLAVDHIKIDWYEQAVLCARKVSSGSSKNGLMRELDYYGFTSDQIDYALKEVGY